MTSNRRWKTAEVREIIREAITMLGTAAVPTPAAAGVFANRHGGVDADRPLSVEEMVDRRKALGRLWTHDMTVEQRCLFVALETRTATGRTPTAAELAKSVSDGNYQILSPIVRGPDGTATERRVKDAVQRAVDSLQGSVNLEFLLRPSARD